MIHTRTPAAALAAAIVALTALSVAGPAAAADEGSGDVTWSVRPANADGADGRSWVELELDPGEEVLEHLALRNLSAETVTFAIKAADGYLTPTGRFNMLPSDTPSVDAGTWVTGPDTVTVAAGETAIVPFTIAVPENATPGDHAAGIAATVMSVGDAPDGNQVAVESRVGFPIMTRVTGELDPSLQIRQVSVDYRISWNPFQPGEVVLVYELVNAGNVRLQGRPSVSAQGVVVDTDESGLELLPGDERTLTTSVPGVWPTFFAPVRVELDPSIVTPDGEAQAADPVSAEFGVWALPLPQLLALLGLALILVAALVGRRRSRMRVEALVAEAREAGRREVEG